MELKEAIKFLMKVAKEYKTYGDLDNPEFEDIKKIPEAIEIVSQALENLQNKNNKLIQKNIEYDKTLEKLIENESINISGFKCIAVEYIQELLEDK